MPRRALVTGANGFIGRSLLRSLTAAGDRVTGWRRSVVPSAPGDPEVAWRELDLRDAAAVDRAIGEQLPEVVFHCAGKANPKDAQDNPADALTNNAIGTLNLLEAVRAHAPRARVVVASSGYVYPVSEHALDEATICRPDGAYGHSKLAQEVVAQHFVEAHGLDVVLARTFNGYGPAQEKGYVISDFVSKVAALERSGETTLSTGNLEHQRDFLHIDDVVSAYEALATRGVTGEAYNVCSGEATRIRVVVDILKTLATRAFDAKPNEKPDRRASDRRVLLGDARKLKGLGWTPGHSLRDGLAETLASWRNAPVE